MNNSLLIIFVSILLLSVVLVLVYFLRRNSDIDLQGDELILSKRFGEQRINLENDLLAWRSQQFRMILWGGIIYGVVLTLKNGRHIAVSSRFYPDTYQKLSALLESRYLSRKNDSG